MDSSGNLIKIALVSPPPSSAIHSGRVSTSHALARVSSGEAVAGSPSTGAVSADQAAPVYFTMPTPPSANHLFKNVKGVGRVKAGHYDDFVRMGVAAIRRQSVSRIEGRVIVIFGVERMSLQADIDNRLKAMLDTIVKSEVIGDDSLVTAIAISWLPKANGLSHVSIYPIQQLDLKFHPSQNGTGGGWFVNVPQQKEDDDGDQPIQS